MKELLFISVTLNGGVKIIIPLDQIAAIREPLPNDELQEGTKTIVVSKIGINLFCYEDMAYFMEILEKNLLRRMDA